MTAYNHDGYGYIINGDLTYQMVAQHVLAHNAVGLLWSDARGAALSLLFAMRIFVYPEGDTNFAGLHLAVRPDQALFVAVRYPGAGMAGFPLGQDDLWPLHPDYVAEKLFHAEKADVTIERIADLINGVRAVLVGKPPRHGANPTETDHE